MHWLRDIFLGILIGIGIVIITGIILSFIYKDEITTHAIKEINKHLVSDISVDKVSFSFLKRFPYAAVEFKDVMAENPAAFQVEGAGVPDTLLFFNHVFLEFRLLDVIKKRYLLRNIYVSDGSVNIIYNERGEPNFNIWKESDKKKPASFYLELQGVKSRNISLNYENRLKNISASTRFDKLFFYGNFSSDQYRLDIQANSSDVKLESVGIQYIKNKNINFTAGLKVHEDTFSIAESHLTFESIPLTVSGRFITNQKNIINLQIKGKEINISQLIRLLPDRYSSFEKKIKGDGYLNFNARVDGEISASISPAVAAEFFVSNGKLKIKGKADTFSDVKFSGRYLNHDGLEPESAFFVIHDMSARYGESRLTGKGQLENLKRPLVNTSLKGKVIMKELSGLIDHDSVQFLAGHCDIDIALTGNIENPLKITGKDIAKMQLAGKIVSTDTDLELRFFRYPIQQFTGTLDLGDEIYLGRTSLSYAGNEYRVSGFVKNVLPYFLLDEGYLEVNGDVSSDNLNFDYYFDGKTGKSNEEVRFPEKLRLKLNLAINRFSLGRFSASSIKGTLNYKPKMFTLQAFSMETLTGKLTGGGAIIQAFNQDLLVRNQLDFESIDIKQLFYTFGNFTQNIIRHDHLEGELSGSLAFSAIWNNNLIIKKETIETKTYIKIVNGELIDFEPMESLSRYIEISELAHIKFSTLENTIIIKDRIITIPRMDIHSSAFNIDISGTHDFDNNINYSVKVLLSEILSGKAKKRNPEFVVEDDGLGRTSIFLKIVGNIDDYKISFDRKRAYREFREDLKEEKKELKSLLQEEFGFYKNDSALVKGEKAIEKPKFRVTWEETEKENQEPPLELPEKKDTTKKKFKIEWE